MNSSDHRGQRSWIPLELVRQMATDVWASNQTLVPWKSSILLLKAEPSPPPTPPLMNS